jgi:hypothetical protein
MRLQTLEAQSEPVASTSVASAPLDTEALAEVDAYLDRLRAELRDLPYDERQTLVEQVRATLELELHLSGSGSVEGVRAALERIGPPDVVAARLRAEVLSRSAEVPTQGAKVPPRGVALTFCRTCCREVSVEAAACPHCGAPWPARARWRGTGYEWKSKQTLWGWPLVHVAVGRDSKGELRVARGIIAIGQFGIGGITIAQFGCAAVLGIGQFMIAPIALGQFALGLFAAGQFGIGLLFGAGQFATGAVAYGMATFGNWFRGR